MPELILSPKAQEQYRSFSTAVQDAVDTALDILEHAPLTNEHVKYVKHPDFDEIYRYKLLDRQHSINHRLFFTLTDNGSLVKVIAILPRSNAYKPSEHRD